MKIVSCEATRIEVLSSTGKFYWNLKPDSSAKELSDQFFKIARYLKSANHRKTGLDKIVMNIKVDDLGAL